jgi:hypothetical protein
MSNLFVFALLCAALQNASGVGKAERTPAPAWTEIRADPILTVLTAPAAARWVLVDDGADLRPDADGKSAAFAAGKPGRYRILVIAGDGEPARVAVIVGAVPGPDGPPPNDDAFLRRLQTAFDLDSREAAKRTADRLDLVELYRQAADLAERPEVTTVAALVARIREASKLLVVEGLADLRKAIAAELAAAFPIDAPLDEATRSKVRALFLKLSAALKSLK